MANVSVYNMEGKEVGTIELNDAVFGVEVNEHLVHMAVVQQLANNRQLPQSPKVRASRAQSRDLDSTEDLWLMVPSSIVIRVPMVHVPLPAVYSRARECLDIWAA